MIYKDLNAFEAIKLFKDYSDGKSQSPSHTIAFKVNVERVFLFASLTRLYNCRNQISPNSNVNILLILNEVIFDILNTIY